MDRPDGAPQSMGCLFCSMFLFAALKGWCLRGQKQLFFLKPIKFADFAGPCFQVMATIVVFLPAVTGP